MRIFIMRHGEAQPLVRSDRDRQLTDYGYNQAAASAQWLKQNYFANTPVDYVLVSPFQRTRQTFACLNEQLEVKQHEYSEDIVPSGQAKLVHDYLDYLLTDRASCCNGIVLVSHMPLVSYLVDELCGQHRSILFSTAAIAVLEYDVDKGRGSLLEQYHPAVIA